MPIPSTEDADRLARAVLRRRLRVKAKETVTVETYPSSLPWATGFVREARRLGAYPLLVYEDEASYWSAVEEGRASIVGSPGEHEWSALKESDVYVYFWGPEDLARRQRLSDSVAEKLTAYNSKWYDLARKSGVRGARMGIARVTERNARLFGVPYGGWKERVLEASLRDPASLAGPASRVAAVLENGRSVRVRHPNGTELTLALAGRKANVTIGEVTAEGRRSRFGLMANVPDASVYVAIDERTADGTFVANRPTTYVGPAPLVDGRFAFRDGRLVRATFGSGGSGFRAEFARAGSGRDSPSFIEVGLDPSLDRTPLLEEALRGTVTVGVGGNASFGGKNSSSFLRYLSLADAELSVDGRTVCRGGRLLLGR